MYRAAVLRSIVPVLLLSALAGTLVNVDIAAAAEPSPEFLTRHVNYSDLDLTRKAGAASLYSRIKSAARAVCDPIGGDVFQQSYSRMHGCVEQAIARAVADVNAPALTSYHAAVTGRPMRLAEAP
jgi:UrcA family protein